jgi:hypothetical protein
VKSLKQLVQPTEELLIEAFFQESAGKWRSERRYYTLPDGKTKEIVSAIAIRFLPRQSSELIALAELHSLADQDSLACGAEVTWDSVDANTGEQKSQGSTIFGAKGNILYRDRGYTIADSVIAKYYFVNPKTLCLRSEYETSVFEEELKLIGDRYRTRQTIISRAGEQMMIGQYLEKRIR